MSHYYVYILLCSDGKFYTGVTNNLDRRIEEHNSSKSPNSFTASRRPVRLVWYGQFTSVNYAIEKEKQIKRWSKAKKQALIDADWNKLPMLSKKKF